MPYDTQDEAIRAALDELEPGDTLIVHNAGCTAARDGFDVDELCPCLPRTWTYPTGEA